MEDSKIIDLFWDRNPLAISETDKKYGSYCYSVAKNILMDSEDSEESVNDTWMCAWNAIPPNRPNILRMFLAKITRCISFNRVKYKMAKKRGGGGN